MKEQTKSQPDKDAPPAEDQAQNGQDEARPERPEVPWKHLPRPTRR